MVYYQLTQLNSVSSISTPRTFFFIVWCQGIHVFCAPRGSCPDAVCDFASCEEQLQHRGSRLVCCGKPSHLVPGVGVEPTLLTEHGSEPCAYANSATLASQFPACRQAGNIGAE